LIVSTISESSRSSISAKAAFVKKAKIRSPIVSIFLATERKFQEAVLREHYLRDDNTFRSDIKYL